MEEHILRIRSINKVTHDVLSIKLDRPPHYEFLPGQATEVAINKPGWIEERRPFTFTSLPTDQYLEFTIKTYTDHKGVTNELLSLQAGDELILHDVWGAISYKGEGLFIAGGAGITPFLSIFRSLNADGKIGHNRLVFANKTEADIIHREELERMLGQQFINVLSLENKPGMSHGFITEEMIRAQIPNENARFYVCGPPPMMDAVQSILTKIGVGDDAIVVEL